MTPRYLGLHRGDVLARWYRENGRTGWATALAVLIGYIVRGVG